MVTVSLDELWLEFILSKASPAGVKCWLTDSGDHVIQAGLTGERWVRRLDSAKWERQDEPKP